MKIKTLLKSYFATKNNNPGWPTELWLNILGPSQLAGKFRRDIKSNPTLQFLDTIFSTFKTNYSAIDACIICDQLGIKDSDSLIKWIDDINKANESINVTALCDIISQNRLIDINLTSMDYNTLVKLINKYCPDLKDYELTDMHFQVPTLEGLKEVVSMSPSAGYPWKTDTLDCEDHARILRGWLSEQNLGNITIAYCEVNAYNNNDFKYAHAINLGVIKDGDDYKFQFIEPQTNTVSNFENFDPPGLNVTRYQIRKLIF